MAPIEWTRSNCKQHSEPKETAWTLGAALSTAIRLMLRCTLLSVDGAFDMQIRTPQMYAGHRGRQYYVNKNN